MQTPDAARIGSVTAMAITAVTHAFNMNQRIVPLSFQAGSGSLNVTLSANANLMPPGYYMLFLVDTNGVPSVSTMLKVTTTVDTVPPTAPSNLVASPSGTQVTLNWTAATDNVGVTGYRVERCLGAGCSNFAQIATPASPTYVDTGLAATTSYSYRVRATDAVGLLGAYSNTATALTGGTVPPATGLVAAYAFNEGSGGTVSDASSSGIARHDCRSELDGVGQVRKRAELQRQHELRRSGESGGPAVDRQHDDRGVGQGRGGSGR